MKTKFLQYSNDDQAVFDEPVILNGGLQGVASNIILDEDLSAGDSRTINIGRGTFLVNLRWGGSYAAGSRTYIYYSWYGLYGSQLLASLVNYHDGSNVHELTFGDDTVTLNVTKTYGSCNKFVLSIIKLS